MTLEPHAPAPSSPELRCPCLPAAGGFAQFFRANVGSRLILCVLCVAACPLLRAHLLLALFSDSQISNLNFEIVRCSEATSPSSRVYSSASLRGSQRLCVIFFFMPRYSVDHRPPAAPCLPAGAGLPLLACCRLPSTWLGPYSGLKRTSMRPIHGALMRAKNAPPNSLFSVKCKGLYNSLKIGHINRDYALDTRFHFCEPSVVHDRHGASFPSIRCSCIWGFWCKG